MTLDLPFSKIALLGPGLIGGSLALAIRERLPGVHLRIWGRRDESVRAVQNLGLAAVASTDVEPVIRDAELVVFCVPVEAMQSLAREILPLVGANAIVTDVGSVKTP